jgi:hypothetical protein
MPRKPTDNDHLEDTMDDAAFEDWETVSEGFGTKIEWVIGARFVGEFTGTRIVPLKEDADMSNPLDTAPAAEFMKDGEKFYSWMPHQLQTLIDNGKLKEGQTVYIRCDKEEATKRGLNPVKVFTIKVKPVS